LAAEEARLEIIEILAESKKFNFLLIDRWGKTTLDIIKWNPEIAGEQYK